MNEAKTNEIKSRLKGCKHYFKTDYKIHISTSEPCKDHCSVFALSTAEKEFRGKCDHKHDLKCDRCEEGKLAITDLQICLTETNFW